MPSATPAPLDAGPLLDGGEMLYASITRDIDRNLTFVEFHGELAARDKATVRTTVAKAVAEAPLSIVVGFAGTEFAQAIQLTVLPMLARLDDQAGAAQPPVTLHWHGLPETLGASIAWSRRLNLHPTREAALAGVGAPPASQQTVRVTLPSDSMTSPPAARLAVGDACTAWGHRTLVNSARWVISELVTNAIRHAGTDIHVTVTLRGRYLYMAVRDGSVAVPRLPPPAEHPTRNRVVDPTGLGMVDQLAVRWGTVPTSTGKIVWAVLAAP